jgi:hypothetical protein
MNKEDHLFKLANEYYKYLVFYDDSGEYGGVGTDCKRPFGDSSVEESILEIIGVKPACKNCEYTTEQLEYARKLYTEDLIPYLTQCWEEFKTLVGQ